MLTPFERRRLPSCFGHDNKGKMTMALPEFTHGEWYCRACTHKGTPWQANGGPGWVWRGCAACSDIWPEQLPEQPADAEVVKVPVSALDHGRTYWYRLANRAAAEIAELKKQVKFLTANGEAHWKNYREANGQLNYFGNALVSAKQDRDAYKNEVEELKVKERIAREALTECEAKLAAAEQRAADMESDRDSWLRKATALENAATLYATLCKARGCLADIIKDFPEVATP